MQERTQAITAIHEIRRTGMKWLKILSPPAVNRLVVGSNPTRGATLNQRLRRILGAAVSPWAPPVARQSWRGGTPCHVVLCEPGAKRSGPAAPSVSGEQIPQVDQCFRWVSTMRTRSAVFLAPSFIMMRARWTSTVRGLMPSRRPASLLEEAAAISASTSASRCVSG